MSPLRRALWVAVQGGVGASLAGLVMVVGLPGLVLGLPLLGTWPGLWRQRRRHYAVASLMLPFYAGGLLMEVHAGGGVPMVALATVTALTFCALLLYLRLRESGETLPSPAPARESAIR